MDFVKAKYMRKIFNFQKTSENFLKKLLNMLYAAVFMNNFRQR